jgi:hypothetical protein
VRVRTYGFPGCLTWPPGTTTRNQHNGIDHVEACRPLGVVPLSLALRTPLEVTGGVGLEVGAVLEEQAPDHVVAELEHHEVVDAGG